MSLTGPPTQLAVSSDSRAPIALQCNTSIRGLVAPTGKPDTLTEKLNAYLATTEKLNEYLVTTEMLKVSHWPTDAAGRSLRFPSSDCPPVYDSRTRPDI